MAALCPVVYATSVASPAHVATKPSARFLTHATDTASFSSVGNQTRSRCHGSAERGHGIAARPWQDPTVIPDGWLLPAQSCLPSSTRVAASSCTLLSGLGRRKGGAALSFEFPVVSTNIHWSTGEAQGMEDNVNTEATGADSSTSCDDSSTNSSHSSRSGGRNEGRVTPPASDGGRTTTAQRSSTGAAEDDDEDGRDCGEESCPLCLPRAPVDRAGMPSECSTNDTAAAVPEQLVERAAPTSNDSGSRCSSSTRRSSLVHTRNDGALHTHHDNTAPHRDAAAVSTGAAPQRSTDETNNAASDSTEVSPVMETSGGYTRSGSSSTQVGGRGDRGAANSAGQDAAVPRPSTEEEVSVVSAEEEESHFLDAEDAETAGLVAIASPGAAAERLDDRREEAAESRSDVCERRQAPDQPQRPEPQPVRQQRQQPPPPQEQQSPPQQQQSPRQPEQRSPQEEDQQREPPEQQQQRLPEEQQVPPAEQPQQQPAELRPGAEQEEQQRQQQQRQERAGGRQRQERRSRQRDRELIGRGAERGALRFWSADEEMYSGSATDSRAFLRGGLDLEGEVFFPADAPESQMRSRDRRDARQQQASHGGEEEEQEENHAEAEAKSEENSSSDDDEEEGAASSSHKKSFGCQHYRRRCKVVAPCCGEAFWCRHCHNDVKCEQEKDFRKAHEIDRTAVTEVICAVCDTRQEVSNQCVSCKVEFGKYYCEKCKFWDDKGIKKKVYHCDLCGLCRTGGADSFFHCTTCGSCYSTDIRGSHKCVEKAMHQPCPICCENMFTSIRQVHVLKCGHTLHADCLERLKSECSGMPRLRCPLCFRSLGEYSVFWRRLDEEVARTPLPQELRRRVSCTCNDCAARTEVDYHVVGLKCGACGSYNTREVGP